MRRLLDKLQNKDKTARNSVASQSFDASEKKEWPLSPAVAITASSPGVGNDHVPSHAATAVSAHKQVAFASSPAIASPELASADAKSLISHHQAGLGCLPTRPNDMVTSSSDTDTPQLPHCTCNHHAYTPLHTASLHIPSHPIRHVSLDAGPRTMAVYTPAVFEATADPTPQSFTSLSYSTLTTTAGSLVPTARDNGHRDLIFGTAAEAEVVQPDLTILANYSRDCSISGGEIVQHLTWSEIVNDELVDNLGARERTRQEVLFEMVCSEERYVQDLIAFRDAYLEPLLRSSQAGSDSGYITSRSANPHSCANSSAKRLPSVPPTLTLATIRAASATPSHSRQIVQDATIQRAVSNDHLPIAARFARRPSIKSTFGSHAITAIASDNTARSSSYGDHTRHTVSRDASGGTGQMSASGGAAVDSEDETDASESHRARQSAASDHLRPLFVNGNASRISTVTVAAPTSSESDLPVPGPVKRHPNSLESPPASALHKTGLMNLLEHRDSDLPLRIPEDLRTVCETIVYNILHGHQCLVAKLKTRYEEQYPLVRTLADVFSNQAWMVQYYAAYVLHLEKALQDIEDICETADPLLSLKKRLRDKQGARDQERLVKTIKRLEEQASMKGQPCLSICLSQPFQRLLKYPLMFQSLLYHTDHCLKEYEATQKARQSFQRHDIAEFAIQLTLEIDTIVRTIESQKATEDDRMKTRDCWARIEDIRDKALLTPRPDRVLVSELALWATASPSVAAARKTFSEAGRECVDVSQLNAAAKYKTVRRLSEMINPHVANETSGKPPSMGSKRDLWLVKFSDVVLRCRRVGVTRLPLSGYAGKSDGRIKLMNRDRNLYRFVQIDRWVHSDAAAAPNQHIQEIDRLRESQRTAYQDRTSERSEQEEFGRHTSVPEMPAISGQQSPVAIFDIDPLIGLDITQVKAPISPKKTTKRVVPQAPSITIQQVLSRGGAATEKFGNRVRPSLGERIAAETARSTSTARASASPQSRAISAANSSTSRTKPLGGKATAASTARAAAIRQRINSGKREGAAALSPEPKRVRATSSDSQTAISSPLAPEKLALPTSRTRRRSLSGPSADIENKPLRTKHSSERLGMNERRPCDPSSGPVLFSQWEKGSPTSVKAA